MRMKKDEYFEWYKDVDFIQKEMQFYSIEDFVYTADYYRDMYAMMNSRRKKMYQWYVFANINLNYKQKTAVWEYLNGGDNLHDLMYFVRVHRAEDQVGANIEQRNIFDLLDEIKKGDK